MAGGSPHRLGYGFGTATRTSPPRSLWGCSKVRPTARMANLGVAGAVAFFRVSVRNGSRSAPSPDAKRLGGSVPELTLAPTRHAELRVHLAPQGGRCGLRCLDRIMVRLSSSGSCRVRWLDRVHCMGWAEGCTPCNSPGFLVCHRLSGFGMAAPFASAFARSLLARACVGRLDLGRGRASLGCPGRRGRRVHSD